MRVLLDECLPRKLKREIPEHQVMTVPEAGWAGKKNGELLRLAATLFDVFVTIDQNLQYQQDLRTSATGTLAIVVLQASSSRLEALLHLIPQLRMALGTIRPGQVVHIATHG